MHEPHWPWSQPFLGDGDAEPLPQGVEQGGAGVDGRPVRRSPSTVRETVLPGLSMPHRVPERRNQGAHRVRDPTAQRLGLAALPLRLQPAAL